ncbi:unnamed protein product [Owenia fusiformis]|uniref:S-adenosylmethionine mitochondrial carrier protein n=1 Tax=Owenia fusiformis TaxID=6347 RepID=A0A8J1XGF1_OWEFU|nr:unnamed protein product [Owenia fusiformis]CAH1783934.1 unnamed protein product [Owenia fusiformis]
MTDWKSFYWASFLAGGGAGLAVDISLFPLDTIKTRLQSAQGFYNAGGFRGIYSGLPSAAIGSVPTAAAFFLTYESMKHLLSPMLSGHAAVSLSHSLAASCGEVMACVIRVPVEVVKQRAQANPRYSSLHFLRLTLRSEGFRGLYRGYLSTVMREVPFSFIEMPIWEYLKKYWSVRQGSPVEAWQSSICGAIAGGLAAGITTPLDVAKTRIMLAHKTSAIAQGHILFAMQTIYKENGIRGLFAGIIPRMMWISIGGAIFLGVYDKIKCIMTLPELEQSSEIVAMR